MLLKRVSVKRWIPTKNLVIAIRGVIRSGYAFILSGSLYFQQPQILNLTMLTNGCVNEYVNERMFKTQTMLIG
jgi:hypothetical protein